MSLVGVSEKQLYGIAFLTFDDGCLTGSSRQGFGRFSAWRSKVNECTANGRAVLIDELKMLVEDVAFFRDAVTSGGSVCACCLSRANRSQTLDQIVVPRFARQLREYARMLRASADNEILIESDFAEAKRHSARPAVFGDITGGLANRAKHLTLDQCGLMAGPAEGEYHAVVRADFPVVVEFVTNDCYPAQHTKSPQSDSECLTLGMNLFLLFSIVISIRTQRHRAFALGHRQSNFNDFSRR
jgi:hypothetical protein